MKHSPLSPANRPPRRGHTRAAGRGLLRRWVPAGLGLVSLLALSGCVAGNQVFAETPAGFWAGLWHGLILGFTFVISLFNEGVHVYEPANAGGLYDLGFVLGVAIFFGSGAGSKKFRSKARRAKEKEWKKISGEVEEKIRQGIESWLKESGQEDKEWEELGNKIQEKIKRELRKWAEK